MLKLSDLIISSSETLRTALRQMTVNRIGVLFVCDEGVHLAGVLSDGDVRRSVLNETMLLSPIDRIMNTDPVTAGSTEEGKKLLFELRIVALPVVDTNGYIRHAVVEDRDSVVILSGEQIREEDRSGGEVMAVIPARGGSKRIPRKNLVRLAGKTLLARTVEAAKRATAVSRVLVSTNDTEIAEAARIAGADVPWLRPESLSADNTPSIDVVIHALQWALDKLNPAPKFAVLLEPTAPLRRGEQIDEAISLLANSDADCVASVSPLPHVFHPEEILGLREGQLWPYLSGRTMNTRRLRAEQESAYVLNGIVYAFRIESVLSTGTLFGRKTIPFITPWDEFVDVDTPADLEIAKLKIEQYSRT